MISSLQPSRPKPPSQASQQTQPFICRYPIHQQTPLNQQSIRYQSPSNPTPASTSTTSSPSSSALLYQHQQQQRPRSQLEAMPPTTTSPIVQFDPSTRHPVFFTDRLQKLPFGMGMGTGSTSSNPVATGYVFHTRDGVGAPHWRRMEKL